VTTLQHAAQWLRDYADHRAGRAPEPEKIQPFEARQWAEAIDKAASDDPCSTCPFNDD